MCILQEVSCCCSLLRFSSFRSFPLRILSSLEKTSSQSNRVLFCFVFCFSFSSFLCLFLIRQCCCGTGTRVRVVLVFGCGLSLWLWMDLSELFLQLSLLGSSSSLRMSYGLFTRILCGQFTMFRAYQASKSECKVFRDQD